MINIVLYWIHWHRFSKALYQIWSEDCNNYHQRFHLFSKKFILDTFLPLQQMELELMIDECNLSRLNCQSLFQMGFKTVYLKFVNFLLKIICIYLFIYLLFQRWMGIVCMRNQSRRSSVVSSCSKSIIVTVLAGSIKLSSRAFSNCLCKLNQQDGFSSIFLFLVAAASPIIDIHQLWYDFINQCTVSACYAACAYVPRQALMHLLVLTSSLVWINWVLFIFSICHYS